MAEMEQYEAFAKLERQGRSVAEIAASFGITETMVRRRLALGSLDPRIRAGFKADRIDGESLQTLTLASKRQQAEWLKLFGGQDEDGAPWDGAPRGQALKHWILGGSGALLAHARFEASQYTGPTRADLFGEEVYALDHELFWRLQDEAIATLADEYRERGWQSVTILPRGQRFIAWGYVRATKKAGGGVLIETRESGEVIAHEGYLTPQDENRRRKAEASEAGLATDTENRVAETPELSEVAERYVALHRHAMVRAALLDHPGMALRLAVAHLLAGAPLWNVRTEDQSAKKPEIAASVAASRGEATFNAVRMEVRLLLGLPDDLGDEIVRPHGDPHRGVMLFTRLLALTDEEVLRILSVAMGETLSAGSSYVDAAAHAVALDPKEWWTPDATFFDLIRDRAVVDTMLVEVAGEAVARGNVSEKNAVKKRIIADCLAGENRPKVEEWTPRYLARVPAAYTPRGTRAMQVFETIADLLAG